MRKINTIAEIGINHNGDLDLCKKIILDGIEYASNFTWEKTAQKTFELYKELWEEFH